MDKQSEAETLFEKLLIGVGVLIAFLIGVSFAGFLVVSLVSYAGCQIHPESKRCTILEERGGL